VSAPVRIFGGLQRGAVPPSDADVGVTRQELLLREQADSPFVGSLPRPVTKDARWANPELVGEVQFAEWTGDGVMRHPSWRGLRPDKSPDDVVRET